MFIKENFIDLYASDKGLCFVGSLNVENEIYDYADNITVLEDNEYMKDYKNQIKYYLENRISEFTFSIDQFIKSSNFNMKVWDALLEIPYGKTASYSDVANSINQPKAVRAVASSIAKNPLLIVVPCHRVVGKNGKLTGYRGGLAMKKSLLETEAEN
ncbi:methylated-DNA--[protein]-cysteine S-methyltransferase [Segetibacter koreensis]|uniref:methylated-DNA--[protein]-cysteine S-methyltransferase n=1 Tax=Segetibacter koreensis TaxID=398037 RepID=UPI0003A8F5F0|nr:methylated-DNA--[protein]-cysteine S-methyltransferase [Segetibacter koreensis]